MQEQKSSSFLSRPFLRYLADVVKYLNKINEETEELYRLSTLQLHNASLTPKKLKQVNFVAQLTLNLFSITEELQEALQEVESLLMLIKTEFRGERCYLRALDRGLFVQRNVLERVKNLLQQLSLLAPPFVPFEFKTHVESVFGGLLEEISFDSVSVQYFVHPFKQHRDEGLAYSCYIWLNNVVNSEEQIVPQMYIHVHYTTKEGEKGLVDNTSTNNVVKSGLGYDWVPPSELVKDCEVENINELKKFFKLGRSLKSAVLHCVQNQNIVTRKKEMFFHF